MRALLVCLTLLPAWATTPKGVAPGDWAQIQALHEKHRHAAVRQADGTLAARNPGQQWRTQFDGRGFTVKPDAGGWTWGLELERFGLAGQLRPASRAKAEARENRVRYQREGPNGLEEWFVNDGRGLEQGFTVARKPAGAGDTLVFDLALRGELFARVAERSVSFTDGAGRGVLNFGGLKAWDADGRVLKAAFEKTATGLRYRVETAGARYPVTVDPVAQQAYLKASNPDAQDSFGYSVAISGDTVVVGAFGESSNGTGQADNSAPEAGAAYVFTRSGTAWSQQAYLKASNPDGGDRFGWSVAISGDTVVVGATFEASNGTGQADNSAIRAGAAYVFTRSAGVWSQQAYLKASNPDIGDDFGSSVAISGDTVVVGAYGEDSNATGVNGNQADNSASGAGAAYVFTRSAGVWSQQAYLKASNPDIGDGFGSSVAISGDTVVVGANDEDSNGTGGQADNSAPEAGAAYIFTIFPGTLSITGGNNQSTPINAAFGTQFQVTVTDPSNNPVPNVTVTFAAPGAGASGTFAGGINTAVTNALGVATAPVFTANGTAGGPYNVTASIVGGANTVNFALTNLPATTVQVTVTTNLNGPQVTVNGGAPFTGTQTFTLNIGAPLTLAAASPQLFNLGQSRYVFQNWSPSNPTTVPATPTTYTANFSIQHLVTVTPTPGGTVSLATGFFDAGSPQIVTATPNPGFAFAGFTGALTGTTNPQTLTVTGPLALAAVFLPTDGYQVRYMSNLNLADSVINLTNTGARGAGLAAGTTATTTGAICVNVYAFSPDEQMVSCCSCPVTPNGLVSLSAQRDLVSNTLTPAVPTSLVVKLLATVPVNNSCTGSAAAVNAANLAPGLLAWGTTIKAPDTVVETPFLPATLSLGGAGDNIGELARLQQLCNFINSNGSGFGVCRSCRLGGLGAGRI
ncbi:MAG: hypothetical protein K2X03_31015 [Bryobacteraceae bacterium]|nr:hypothetical protein [Bryobacteraceae bacterium]